MIKGNLSEIAAWLKSHDDFAVMGHVSPDGDCCGSCIGITLALREMGKRAYATVPGGLPKRFMKYPHEGILYAAEETPPFAARSGFVVDVSDSPRLGANSEILKNCADVANLDHHATNEGGYPLHYVDTEAAACGEIAVSLLELLNVPLNPTIAQWLYIAILTDCGQFGYSNTRPETLRAAAKLMETGIDVAQLVRDQYHTTTRAKMLLDGRVYSELKLSADGKVVSSRLTREMLDSCGALPEDNEGIVSKLLEIEGTEVAILAEERVGESTKVSMRSKNYVDVARDIAKRFGGGGHSRAAGCPIEADVDTALAMVLEVAEAAVKQS